MVRPGVLRPADSGAFIANHSKYVKIHADGLENLCEEMLMSIEQGKLKIPDTGANISYLSKDDPNAVDFIFVCDALNFCFWSYSEAEKWTVDGHSGYYALEAALCREMKSDNAIIDAAHYSQISPAKLREILRSDNDTQIPLFEERVSVLHEVGKVLLDKYNGTFKRCIKKANKSAEKLLEFIVENFPCFRDEAEYNGKKVSLYKRAQILVSDLWNFFGGEGWGEFSDIDKITMFADYRIPQVLVYFGVLSYSDDLMQKLEKELLLPNGSQEEVEIRGCSIHAVELLKRSMEEKIIEFKMNGVEVLNSCLIDYYLWCYRRKYADELEKIPFHRTLSIYY